MSDVKVLAIQGKGSYQFFRQITLAFVNQPEYLRLYGRAWMWVLLHLTWVRHHLSIRTESWIVVYHEGQIVGGFSINKKGELGNLIVTKDHTIQHQVLLKLLVTLRGMLLANPREFIVRTYNARLFKGLPRLGFKHYSEKDSCKVTIPLGWFTFSLVTNYVPRIFSHWLRIQPYYYLHRLPD